MSAAADVLAIVLLVFLLIGVVVGAVVVTALSARRPRGKQGGDEGPARPGGEWRYPPDEPDEPDEPDDDELDQPPWWRPRGGY
jgi:hypothetical protein